MSIDASPVCDSGNIGDQLCGNDFMISRSLLDLRGYQMELLRKCILSQVAYRCEDAPVLGSQVSYVLCVKLHGWGEQRSLAICDGAGRFLGGGHMLKLEILGGDRDHHLPSLGICDLILSLHQPSDVRAQLPDNGQEH